MNDNYKNQYEPPVTKVVDIIAEGFVCISAFFFCGFGEEEVW